MRFLIVGAGAVGGYFGGRLAQKGEDVTFLVRPARRKQLENNGIVIRSVHGDYSGPVQTISSGEQAPPFDVVILSVKAYHLPQVIKEIHPYVGESTVLLPLLNGYDHYRVLTEHFGQEKVLGGLCFIETTLNQQGEIVQTSQRHDLVFGEWDGSDTERSRAIEEHMSNAGFVYKRSQEIQSDVWQKFIFISCMSGITTLMQSPIGAIMTDPHARETYQRLIDEIVSIARFVGAPVNEDAGSRVFSITESLASEMKSSMQRDMEKGLPVEADHLHGSLLTMATQSGKQARQYPTLQTVYANLKVYEAGLL